MPDRPDTRELVVVLASIASGVLAAFADVSPTGAGVVDALLVGAAAALVTWIGAAASPVVVGVVALVAGALSGSPWLAAIGVIAFAVAVLTRSTIRREELTSAALALVAINIAARASLDWFLGAETIVAIGIAAALTLVGLGRRSRRTRRLVAGLAGVYMVVGLVGTAATAIAGVGALDDLRAADDAVDEALDEIIDGDVEAARTSIDTAISRLSSVESSMSGPLTPGAAIVPVVAQHRRAALDVASSAGEAMEAINDELDAFDVDALMVGPGTIDIEAVRALEAPLLDFQQELRDVIVTIDDVRSPWLFDRVDTELDDLEATVDDQLERGDLATDVVRTAPSLLGADGPRTYFLGFSTPAEARGLGGFMGLVAEITADDGRIEMTEFGRIDRFDRELQASDEDYVLDGPQEWLSRYSEFGFAGPSSPPGTSLGTWGNVTMSPDATATGEVIAQLYPASGGSEVDGVFVADVIAVSQLLELTGPVTTSSGVVLDADSAAEFLLNGQYENDDRPDRADLLEEVASTVVDDLLGGSLPSPAETIDVLGPMVDAGRVVGWAVAGDEQALLERVGLAGRWPDDAEGDAVAVAFNDTTGNKLDYFLRARAHYDAVVDAPSSTLSGTLLVELENRPPPTPQPDYVAENVVGLPRGWNRIWVSVYTRVPVTDLTVDGRPAPWDLETEAGFFVSSTFVTMAPGDVPAIELTLDGAVDLVDDEYHLTLWSPPTARPTPVTADVRVDHADGTSTDATAETLGGAVSLTAAPSTS